VRSSSSSEKQEQALGDVRKRNGLVVVGCHGRALWLSPSHIRESERSGDSALCGVKPSATYGARFIARGGKTEPQEGSPRARVIVLEFPTYTAALDCYRSPEFKLAH
jgi:uncharacterized protein (DUF1330 family)